MLSDQILYQFLLTLNEPMYINTQYFFALRS